MVENFNLLAEQSVIGAILHNNESFDHIHDLPVNAFYQSNHAELYRAIAEMMQEKKPIDVLTLAEYLESKGKLESVGGIGFIAEIASGSASSVNIKRYAEIVQEKSMLRNLQAVVNGIQQDLEGFGDIGAKLERAQSAIMAITENKTSAEPQFIGDLLLNRFEHFEKLFMGEIKPIGTGLIDLDKNLGGGFEGGQMIVIAARPAMGKSALAVQLAEHIQTDDGAGLIFSCEMSNEQITDRVISSHAKVASDVLRNGKFSNEDWDKLSASIPKVKGLKLLVDDKSTTLNSIASKARTVKRKHGLNIIVVDYLQLLEGVGDIREQQVASISRGLKKLALELNIPVIALTQLNRGVEQRQNKRPVMSDIRESGAIEQDADVIIAIYRDEEYNPDTTDKGTAELIILKNRNGKTNRLRTTFVGEFTRFENFDGVHFQPQTTEPKRYSRGFND